MNLNVDASRYHNAVGSHWQPHDAPPPPLDDGVNIWDFGHLVSHSGPTPTDSVSPAKTLPTSFATGGGARSPLTLPHHFPEPGANSQLIDSTVGQSVAMHPKDLRHAAPDPYTQQALNYTYKGVQAASQPVSSTVSQFDNHSEYVSQVLSGSSVSAGNGVRPEELEPEWQLEQLLGHIDALEGTLCASVSVCACARVFGSCRTCPIRRSGLSARMIYHVRIGEMHNF
jgi:hypothetical protein